MGLISSEAKFSSPSRQTEIGLVEAIACWCECLAGHVPLREGLRALVESLNGEAIALTRIGGSSSHTGRSLLVERRSVVKGPRLARSYASVVLGPYVNKPRTATIWFSSMTEHDAEPVLSEFQSRRRFRELVVIPLSVSDKSVDFLEIHFVSRLDTDGVAALNGLLGTLIGTWGRRATGLFIEAAISGRSSTATPDKTIALLDYANPTRLSRAEYRVCLLLSRGLSTSGIQSELEISSSTVRSHLRSIYAKTGASSLAELTYQLLTYGHEIASVRSQRKA